MAFLEVAGLNVYYGDVQVIHGLSLTVEEGEIVTLVGSNGAGKTTTVNTLSGVLRPRSGTLRYRGGSLEGVPAHARVAQGLVQVPEGRLLFPQLTVRENLRLGSYCRAVRAQCEQTLETVYSLFPHLLERSDQAAGTLSGGEQQMVAIGRGLMAHPRLLILD